MTGLIEMERESARLAFDRASAEVAKKLPGRPGLTAAAEYIDAAQRMMSANLQAERLGTGGWR